MLYIFFPAFSIQTQIGSYIELNTMNVIEHDATVIVASHWEKRTEKEKCVQARSQKVSPQNLLKPPRLFDTFESNVFIHLLCFRKDERTDMGKTLLVLQPTDVVPVSQYYAFCAEHNTGVSSVNLC